MHATPAKSVGVRARQTHGIEDAMRTITSPCPSIRQEAWVSCWCLLHTPCHSRSPKGAVVPDREIQQLEPEGQDTFLLCTLGATIRQYRKQRGLSQQALATKASLHHTYVSDIELGQRNVSVLSLFRIANALQLPLSSLLIALEAYQDVTVPPQK